MQPTIISPLHKDKVLKLLCLDATPEKLIDFKISPVLKEIEVTYEVFDAVLSYFNRNGFISDLNLRMNHCSLILRVEANDYYLRGGFAFQEDVLEKNIEKLQLEIEHLKKTLGPDQLETVNKLSSISSAILTGIGLLAK